MEVGLGGLYDATNIVKNSTSTITTIDFDSKEIGMVACQTLLDIIEKKRVAQVTMLSYQVVLKESTA